MKAYVIKDLESDMYLYDNYKFTDKILEATKFDTQALAKEHTDFLIGYFEIITIIYRTKDYGF